MKKLKGLSAAGIMLAFCLPAGLLVSGCNNGQNPPPPPPASPSETAGQAIDDTGVTARVKTALAKDTYKYPDVKVSTMQGTVQLSGFADTKDEKARAGQIAKGVDGVKNVDNEISVKS